MLVAVLHRNIAVGTVTVSMSCMQVRYNIPGPKTYPEFNVGSVIPIASEVFRSSAALLL